MVGGRVDPGFVVGLPVDGTQQVVDQGEDSYFLSEAVPVQGWVAACVGGDGWQVPHQGGTHQRVGTVAEPVDERFNCVGVVTPQGVVPVEVVGRPEVTDDFCGVPVGQLG